MTSTATVTRTTGITGTVRAIGTTTATVTGTTAVAPGWDNHGPGWDNHGPGGWTTTTATEPIVTATR